uniref:MIF4G domain-containing protein n=1 Tax=Eptatretus burgeri TaxID=7764 RepID=A0A8C4R4P7_EPTBU
MKKGIDGTSRLDDDKSKDKARRRAVGNVVFIGEPFNVKVLDESLISTAIKELLDDACELSLECFCRLLVVTGKILDSAQVTKMNGYFTSLDELMKERKMPLRICFMVQDLIDLRMQNWIPRQMVERPQQLKNIREEASVEQPFSKIFPFANDACGSSIHYHIMDFTNLFATSSRITYIIDHLTSLCNISSTFTSWNCPNFTPTSSLLSK